MNRLISTLFAVTVSSLAFAESFTSGNINYTMTSETTVEVAKGEYSGKVTIPQSVSHSGKTYAVTGIGQEAFMKCSDVTSITLPEGLEYLNNDCLRGTSITECNLPSTLKTIKDATFSGCTKLEKLTIPASVEYLGGCFMKECESLTEITLPATIKKFSFYQAFLDCTNLKTVNVRITPETATNINDTPLGIGQYCFRNCPSLEAVRFVSATALPIAANGESFESFTYGSPNVRFYVPAGSKADYVAAWGSVSANYIVEVSVPVGTQFEANGISYTTTSSMTAEVSPAQYSGAVTIPQNVTYKGYEFAVTGIGQEAFYKCCDVTSITLPEGLEYMNNDCLRGTSITECNLPSTLRTIKDATFSGCTKLEKLTIPASVEYLGGCFMKECASLTEITLPATIKKFSFYQAFLDCTNLKTVNVEITPETATNINDTPLGIGQYCFRNCPSLEAVHFVSATALPIAANGESFESFTYGSEKIKFYVPAGSKADYVAAWGTLSSSYIVETKSTTKKAISNASKRNADYDYDLNGRRVDDSYKGIRVRGGKLMMKK